MALRWAWLCLAAIGLFAVLWMTRYQHIHHDENAEVVWDRWRHRACAFALGPNGPVTICWGDGEYKRATGNR
jgi:hypothetical protein